jgi:hypothetical protein
MNLTLGSGRRFACYASSFNASANSRAPRWPCVMCHGILSADWRVDPRHETGSKGVSSGSIHTSQNLVSQESVDHPEAYRERFFAT